jgi:hypothetical protein
VATQLKYFVFWSDTKGIQLGVKDTRSGDFITQLEGIAFRSTTYGIELPTTRPDTIPPRSVP